MKTEMEGNVAELERRYQVLFDGFQTGKLDETTFIAEVEKLQFRDDWGRYWMLGTQTGAWHYYDGQAWHQADPRDADKLPFLDEQGRYWQRGIKSGEWYYYDSDTREWVKPGEGDPLGPATFNAPQWQTQPATPYYAQPQSQGTQPDGYGAGIQNQFGTDLFQDDEGRYWAIGAKTQQWYFYDEQGWHPAYEFQARTASQIQQPSYGSYSPHSQATQTYNAPAHSQPTQGFQPQAQPSDASRQSIPLVQTQPNQPYTSVFPANAPQPTYQPSPSDRQQPTQNYVQPQPTQPNVGQMPTPPQESSQSGAWYYFDGSQWLKYSTGEPAKDTPPDPTKILEHETNLPKNKAEPKGEPVVAELFEADEPPAEVVDVEVITVVEAEPDPQPESTTKPKPRSEPRPKAENLAEAIPPPLPRRSDEVRPRRSKTAPIDVVEPAGADERPPRRRTTPLSTTTESKPAVPPRRTELDPNRPVTPRQKATQPDPTITIPAGAAVANVISSPTSTRISRPSKPILPEHRRAHEATLPMNPVPIAKGKEEPPTPLPAARHRQVTQAMPKISSTPRPAPEPKLKTSTQPIRQPERGGGQPIQDGLASLRPGARLLQSGDDKVGVVTPPANQQSQTQQLKESYTFGDVLRSFPSTLWTGVAGVAVMLIFAVLIIIAVTYGSSLFGVEGIASAPNPTPTLDSALAPDSTPTPAPTSVNQNEAPAPTPTPGAMVTFSSPELDFTLEYPGNWELDETLTQAIFAPTQAGLDPDATHATSMRIGISEDDITSISALLRASLAAFPSEAKNLNEGTISIASQIWTSSQIQFEDEDSGEQGIATVAVTNRDGQGYFLIAVAPAGEWNSVQPVFQAMINSFKFGVEKAVAQAAPKPAVSQDEEAEVDSEGEKSNKADEITSKPTSTPTPKPTPTPAQIATPLVYRIQSGDTLLGIAVKFGVDMELLAQENGITSPESLQIDQELIIPFTAEELAAYNAGTSINSAVADTPKSEANQQTTGNESNAPVASNPDTSTQRAPAPVSGRIVYPAFNPSVNSYDVWMVDLATGEQTPIAGNASQPAFNRDGALLAYRSWDRATRGIFFRDFVGGRGGIVTRFVEDGLPTWSPDGYSFAFASRKEGDRVPRIYVGNQLGDDTFSIGFQGEYPDTFPDGRLVIKGCTPSGDCGLFVMGARGGGETKISGEVADTAPAVSPDGAKIAVMSSGRGAKNWEIFVMNANGSDVKRLTENGNNDGLPAWSPDGRSIAFVSDRGGVWAVWVMNTDGSNQRKLFDMKGSPDGKVLHDEPNSRGWLEERISWAP